MPGCAGYSGRDKLVNLVQEIDGLCPERLAVLGIAGFPYLVRRVIVGVVKPLGLFAAGELVILLMHE